MDCRLIILLIVLVCQVKGSPKDILIPALKDLFTYKCFKHGGVEKAEEFVDATYNYFDCLKAKRKSSSLPEQAQSTFAKGCQDTPRSSYDCLKDYTDVFEPCLETPEKYLVEFLHGTYNVTSDFVCQGRGEYLRSLNIHSIRVCGEEELKVLTKCLPNSDLMKHFGNCDCTIKKPRLCRDLHELTQCLSDGLRKHCAHDRRVANFFGDITEVYTVMCSSDEIFGNLVY